VYGQLDFITSTYNQDIQPSATSFYLPGFITLDSGNNLYVADSYNNRILLFPNGGTTATRVYGQTDFTTREFLSASASGFNYPSSVAVDSDNNVYVADFYNNRVLFFPPSSTAATRVYGQLGSLITANQGYGTTGLYQPTSPVVDKNNNLYVADYSNCRVLFFPAGTTTATRVYGQPLNQYGQETFDSVGCGTGPNRLAGPSSVAVDSLDNLYVADYGNHRVLFYPAGSTTPTRVYGQPDFTSSSYSPGASATTFTGPLQIAVDKNNNLYVADHHNHRVLVFPSGSTTPTRVYGQPDFTSQSFGTSATKMKYPSGVAVDINNNLYVSENHNQRVLVFPPCDLLFT
jgi:sugar lactone lactonase YvrE